MKNNEKELDELLIQACSEPNQRPKFLEALLNADIYCIGTTGNEKGAQQLTEGSHVQLMHFQDKNGDSYLPFFTALENLQKTIDEEQSYLCLPCKSFFELTLGAQLVLNPNSEYGKAFTPTEVEALINGNYGSYVESYEYQETTEVLLSQPLDYPHEMVKELKLLLKTLPQVKAAYLAQMHDPQRDPEPTLLIGFETDQHLDETMFQRIKNQIGHVAYESLVNKRLIDLLYIEEKNASKGVSYYLQQQTEAFYKRVDVKKKGFFARIFSK